MYLCLYYEGIESGEIMLRKLKIMFLKWKLRRVVLKYNAIRDNYGCGNSNMLEVHDSLI